MKKILEEEETPEKQLLPVLRRTFEEETLSTVGRALEGYSFPFLRAFFEGDRKIDIPQTRVSVSLDWFGSKQFPSFYFYVEENNEESRGYFCLYGDTATTLPFSSLTVVTAAKKLEKFLTLYKNVRSEDLLDQFRLFVLNESTLERTTPQEQKEIDEVGRQRFPGEKEWYTIDVFKKTTADDGKAILDGYCFPGKNKVPEEISTIRVLPLSTVSSVRENVVQFSLGEENKTIVKLPKDYCAKMTREEMSVRFLVSARISGGEKKNMAKIINGLSNIEDVLGILPKWALIPVAKSYFEMGCPFVFKDTLGDRPCLYVQGEDSTAPKVVVSKMTRELEIKKFVGACVLGKKWPTQDLLSARASFAIGKLPEETGLRASETER